MKCPKCDYLGFETGDRCKNCGYDFSLLTAAPRSEPDLPLRDSPPVTPAPSMAWLDHFDSDRHDPRPDSIAPIVIVPTPEIIPRPAPAARPRLIDPALPLFNPEGIDDDTPLVRLPATPRPPLAVRRTPETPRLRAVPRPSRRAAEAAAKAETEPVLAFADEPAPELPPTAETSGPARRLIAAAVDHAILLGIDAAVIYFTLKLAELTTGDWRSLPAVPLLAFLALVKASYFCVFTLVGGQTIGKMAAQIRVIAEDSAPMDPGRAVRRTLAGALSILTLGLAFLPALIASDRRALHDRVAGTRVIAI